MTTRSRRTVLRRVVIAAGVFVAVGVLLLAGKALLAPAPSSDTITEQVAARIAADGQLAGAQAAATQFTRAYLTSAGTTTARNQRSLVLNTLTGGQGSSWVASPEADSPTRFVVSGPDLALPPRKTGPGTWTLTLQAWTGDQSGGRELVTLAVPVRVEDTGVAMVAAPPVLLPSTTTTAAPLEPVSAHAAVTSAAEANMAQFLEAWAQAGPDNADAVTRVTVLTTPDATFYTRTGLNGQVTLVKMDRLALMPTPADPNTATGTVTVTWQHRSGEKYKQEYAVTMQLVAGKWLVRQLGSR